MQKKIQSQKVKQASEPRIVQQLSGERQSDKNVKRLEGLSKSTEEKRLVEGVGRSEKLTQVKRKPAQDDDLPARLGKKFQEKEVSKKFYQGFQSPEHWYFVRYGEHYSQIQQTSQGKENKAWSAMPTSFQLGYQSDPMEKSFWLTQIVEDLLELYSMDNL